MGERSEIAVLMEIKIVPRQIFERSDFTKLRSLILNLIKPDPRAAVAKVALPQPPLPTPYLSPRPRELTDRARGLFRNKVNPLLVCSCLND